MSVNKVILLGNVGKDPEVKFLEKQKTKVASFSFATSEKYKDKEQTEWHNIICWGSLAELVEKYVKKGMSLYIEGKITTRKWESEGTTRSVTEIQATSLQFVGKKDDLPF